MYVDPVSQHEDEDLEMLLVVEFRGIRNLVDASDPQGPKDNSSAPGSPTPRVMAALLPRRCNLYGLPDTEADVNIPEGRKTTKSPPPISIDLS